MVGRLLAVLAAHCLVVLLVLTRTDAPVASSEVDAFRFGIVEDFNRVSEAPRFEAMLLDIKSRGFDSVLLTNGSLASQEVALSISDRLNVDVYLSPMGELYAQWWNDRQVPETIEAARAVIYPLVDRLKVHPSLKGYNIADEPDVDQAEKVRLAIQAFRERDPARPAFPVLIGTDRVPLIVRLAQPQLLVIDVYPVAQQSGPCDFTLRAFGYPQLDFVTYTRRVTEERPADVPLWFILQTHGNVAGLREPSVEEVRLQTWLAIAEGARGIYWFAYSSQQGWRGLVDNPALYAEVTTWTERLAKFRPHLSRLHKVEDRFVATGHSHASTLASRDGTRLYAVVVNRLCRAQTVSLRTMASTGLLRDVESGQLFPVGAELALPPGGGRLLEWIHP